MRYHSYEVDARHHGSNRDRAVARFTSPLDLCVWAAAQLTHAELDALRRLCVERAGRLVAAMEEADGEALPGTVAKEVRPFLAGEPFDDPPGAKEAIWEAMQESER